MSSLTRLIRLSRRIGELQCEFDRLKASMADGDGVRRYTVRETKVRGYVRRGYEATRILK